MEKLYLKPGSQIGKKGLPGGKLECKKGDDPLLVEDKYLTVIEKNIDFFKSEGRLMNQAAYDKFMTVEEKPDESGKTDKRLALEKEATEFGIEFTDRTSGKDLTAEIELKKSGTTITDEAFEELKKSATELEIKFDADISFDDLTLLVEDALK